MGDIFILMWIEVTLTMHKLSHTAIHKSKYAVGDSLSYFPYQLWTVNLFFLLVCTLDYKSANVIRMSSNHLNWFYDISIIIYFFFFKIPPAQFCFFEYEYTLRERFETAFKRNFIQIRKTDFGIIGILSSLAITTTVMLKLCKILNCFANYGYT